MRGAHPRVVLGLHRSRHERRLLTAALDLGVTAIDTSTNYISFRSHEILARTVGDLLPKFTLSTKVGYFPRRDRAEHSLDPVRLCGAVEQAARELRREPDVVFLHNPEHSLQEASSETVPHNMDVLAQACAALDDATARGLCGAWGIASWDPSPLQTLIGTTMPRPSVLMVRAGLLVGSRTLDAADSLTAAWGMSDGMVWGMSPFGGSTGTPVWDRIDPRVFLVGDSAGLSRLQAAFRAAYHLPRIDVLAVGTDDPAHLGELIGALAGEVDERAIHEYRNLLRDRSRGQPV
ncbi:aldo/keto reductase [Streptomyces sp. NPDC048751]|uniref:aldo/keto reductase n=1 Tax=Streptomyces sp. NPDC048751 TaxID=3365591 RepID=UPI003714FE94